MTVEIASLLKDHDKAIALLRSVAAECDDGDEHAWRRCRSCLAKEELEHRGVKPMLRAFLAALSALSREDGAGQDGTATEDIDFALQDMAGAAFSDLCEGDGEHTEALDMALLGKHLRAAFKLGQSAALSPSHPGPPAERWESYQDDFGAVQYRKADSAPLSERWQELFWALPPGPMRHKLRSLEIDIGRALIRVDPVPEPPARTAQEKAPTAPSPRED